ncbi:MAG: carboxypeptidase regulatory-like domain-containing protein [Gammaproteobacteria bacterium]|nr:carboxypeptidase regulatory-like domain-containing protein [Gammaproteobacteria bacterium]
MKRIKLLLIAVLLLFSVGCVSGFSNTIQRTSDDVMFYDLANSGPGSGAEFSIENIPSTYPTANSYRMYPIGGGTASYGRVRLWTENEISPNYYSFTIREGSDWTNSGTTSFYIEYLNPTTSAVEKTISFDEFSSLPTTYEVIRSGSDEMIVYMNGVVTSNEGVYYSGETIPRLVLYKGANTGVSILYVDDITTESGIVGMDEDWDETDDNIDLSYSIKEMYKSATVAFPDETINYTLTSKKVITGATKNTTIISNDYGAGDTPAGFIRWNRSVIYGLDYGTYLVDLKRDGSIIDSTYFNYAYSGAPSGTLVLDSDSYSQGQTATATYTLTSPDFATYTYKINTYDVYATEIDTHTISASSGTIEQALLDYDTGIHYFVLLTESKVDGSVSELAYDYATITETVYVYGNATEAFTGTNMENVSIQYLQGSTYYNTTSAADGSYNVSDLTTSVLTAITANSTFTNHSTWQNNSYELATFSFTPLAAEVFNINLIMFDVNLTFDNATSYGLITDQIYNQPIESATVNIYNATWSDSTNTSATGLYYFNNLVNGTAYTVNVTATGYTDSIDYPISITTNATRQDIQMATLYTVTVKAKDATSTAYLSDFTATLDGVEASAVGGVVTFTDVEYGLHAVTAVASDYYPRATTPLIDEDTEVTLSLTRTPSQYYAPHKVKFTLMSLFLTRYSGVPVVVYQGASATGDEYLTGTTGADGVVVFELTEDAQYTVTFIDATQGINKEITLYPVDNEYTVYVVASTIIDDLLNPDDEDQAITAIDISVSKTIMDSTTANITVSYNDIMDETNGLTFVLSQSIAGNMTNRTILSTTVLGTTNNTAHNFTVTDYNGQSYFIEIDLTHDTHGAISRTYGVEFENTDTRFGFAEELVGWFAIIFLTWFALTATQLTVPQTAIGVCGLSTVMMLIGWGYYISVPGLALAWIISIAANMATSKESVA